MLKVLPDFPVPESSGILPLVRPLMNLKDQKERIDALCAKVIAAPDGTEEFRVAMQELRFTLNQHTERMRKLIAEERHKESPDSKDPREG